MMYHQHYLYPHQNTIKSIIRILLLDFVIMMSILIDSIVGISFGGTWEQVGMDINGAASEDQSGYSVAISADGTTIAIGAPLSRGGLGYVRVHGFDVPTNNWIQIGSDIIGNNLMRIHNVDVVVPSNNLKQIQSYLFGWSIALSADGKTIVISAPSNDIGRVGVYTLNVSSSNWVQVGTDIIGTEIDEGFGGSVSISDDGKTIAIGAPNIDATNIPYVSVFSLDSMSNDWTQVGANINGEGPFDQFGYSISMSADGKTIAVGAPSNTNANGVASGLVRVYSIVSPFETWTQVGQDIFGGGSDENSGSSVAISMNGKTIAIGEPNSIANGCLSGRVCVYAFDATLTGTWLQVGSDIEGKTEEDSSGYSVSISADGKVPVVAIGAIGTSTGRVYVYSVDSPNRDWKQVGSDIVGEAFLDYSGWSVALSADGSIVAIGAPYNDNANTTIESGHVRVYKYDSSSTNCGIFGLNLFCPRPGKCGLFRRLFGLNGC